MARNVLVLITWFLAVVDACKIFSLPCTHNMDAQHIDHVRISRRGKCFIVSLIFIHTAQACRIK